VDLRAIQQPLKDGYREDAAKAGITLRADASTGGDAMSCSVDIGRTIYESQAHSGVGGAGTAACSGDLLLGALAACAQVTCQMVAAASGIPLRIVDVRVEGDLDLRGTLGMSRTARVGFSTLRVHFDIDAPEATPRQIDSLQRATEQYCVVLQTLMVPPEIEAYWHDAEAAAGS
jgi:uncharacterized OsmC-like protein